MSDTEGQSELGASELGTKEYWDSAYETELKNFEDHGDVGEVWFGEDSALRVIRWMSSSSKVKEEDSIIDLGCGNGMFLVELAREGFTNLTGIDYSKTAIDLAEAVAKSEELSIKYQVCDLLADSGATSPSSLSYGKFRIALDKGTYDAISLNPDNPREKRLAYLKSVSGLLASGGLFILTSCNWTKAELDSQIKDGFKLIYVIPTPKFQFGGKTGSLVTSLVFEKTS